MSEMEASSTDVLANFRMISSASSDSAELDSAMQIITAAGR